MTAFGLAVANLRQSRGRTAVSVVGAAFAVVLVFMQLGFLGAVNNTATLLYDKLRFDLLVMSREYLDLSRAGDLNRGRLAQATAVPGVAEAVPITLSPGQWRNPTDDPVRGKRRATIQMLGLDPGSADRVFRGVFDDPAGLAAALGRNNTAFLDAKSRPDFGGPDIPLGTAVELNGRQVELAGYFRLGTGFSYTGLLVVNEETLHTLTGKPPSRVTFGLLTLAPGADPDATAAAVAESLPKDVVVYTRPRLATQERDFWVNRTAVGQFFAFGVVLALLVGAIFIYQMMAADITNRLPEYATLKAVGYRFGYLFRVVVWQALLLAAGGYAVGLVAALGLYELAKEAARLPITMPAERLALVLALAVGMCVGSGLVAVRKVRTADPADLF